MAASVSRRRPRGKPASCGFQQGVSSKVSRIAPRRRNFTNYRLLIFCGAVHTKPTQTRRVDITARSLSSLFCWLLSHCLQGDRLQKSPPHLCLGHACLRFFIGPSTTKVAISHTIPPQGCEARNKKKLGKPTQDGVVPYRKHRQRL